jgi:RNA polymerase sigma factor (sigma-70 family)
MAAESTDKVIRQLRHVLGLDDGGLADAELLSGYVERRDLAAFESLVRRHGSLVWGVCRRILDTDDDTADAFQATFLVFARKASKIQKRDSVGSWLYGVARQIARQLQRQLAVRRRRERGGNESAGYPSMNADPVQSASLRELAAVLGEELAKLSAANRAALVACYLEGQSAAAAARQLGIPASTLKTRLERGIDLLRTRLLRRGIDMSTVALAIVLGEQGRIGAAPAVVDATVKAALSFGTTGTAAVGAQVISLATKAIRAMTMLKVTTGIAAATMLGLLGVVGAAAAVLQASDPKKPPPGVPAMIDVVAPRDGEDQKEQDGDPLPAGAIARLGTNRWRHDRAAAFAAFLPDGNSVVTVGDDMTIRVWEYPTGKPIRRIDLYPDNGRTLTPDFRVNHFFAAALSPDGKTIATAVNYAGHFQVHDLASGQRLAEIFPKGRTGAVAMSFSADGRRLAFLGHDGTAEVWAWPERKQVSAFEVPGRHYNPRPLALSPNGRVIAAIDIPDGAGPIRNEQLKLWNVDNGMEIVAVEKGKNIARLSPVFSPDGKTLAFAGFNEITFADAATGKEIKSIRFKGWRPQVLSFSKDGAKLYSHHDDNSVKEWDIAGGTLLRELGFFPSKKSQPFDAPRNGIYGGMTLSPNGKTLALAGIQNRPLFIDIAGGAEAPPANGHGDVIVDIQFAPNGKHLLTQEASSAVRRWPTSGGADFALAMKVPEGSHGPFVISPDAKVALVALPVGKKRELHFIDAATGAILGRVTPTQNWFYSGMTMTDDGKKLVLSSLFERRIEVFECPSGKLLHVLADDSAIAKAADFGLESGRRFDLRNVIVSPGGKWLASYADVTTLVIWDLATGRRRGTVTQPSQEPNRKLHESDARPFQSGAFSPDGRCLALDFRDGTVIAYELATGQKRIEFGRKPDSKDHSYFPPSSTLIGNNEPKASPRLAYAPNGRTLAYAAPDQIVRLWDASTCKELAAFRGHTGPVMAVAFAPDGTQVASAGWDTTALVWDVRKWSKPEVSPRKLDGKELAAHWELLADSDAANAYAALVALTAGPNEVVPFLQQRLKPTARIDPERINRLIGDFDSANFKVRDKANSELLDIADVAAPALEKALANNPSLETRRRLQALLEKSGTTSMILQGDRLRAHRAVEVLERIGTPEARRLLTSLAAGAPGALQTRAAEDAFQRLR